MRRVSSEHETLTMRRAHGAGGASLEHARTAFYQKRGARHLDNWQYYRLTRDDLERLVAPHEQ